MPFGKRVEGSQRYLLTKAAIAVHAGPVFRVLPLSERGHTAAHRGKQGGDKKVETKAVRGKGCTKFL